MKIIYKFGPRAGETAHVPRSQEIQVLLNAGIIEEVPLTDGERAEVVQSAGHTIPPNFSTPVWSVETSPHTGTLLVARRFRNETTLFDGPPDRKQWPDCPETLAAEFERQRSKGVPLVR